MTPTERCEALAERIKKCERWRKRAGKVMPHPKGNPSREDYARATRVQREEDRKASREAKFAEWSKKYE